MNTKIENIKNKIRTNAPAIIAITSLLTIVSVTALVIRKQSKNLSSSPFALETKSCDLDTKNYDLIEIGVEEMAKYLEDGRMTAFMIDEEDLNFYKLPSTS